MRLSFTFATMMLSIALIHPAHASCSDRPGTPNHLSLRGGPPGGLDLRWINTASEAGGVTWDLAILKNGKPIRGWTGSAGGNRDGKYWLHHFTGLDYAAEYCFKIRARTGLGSNGCVSDRWSETVCAHPTFPRFGPR